MLQQTNLYQLLEFPIHGDHTGSLVRYFDMMWEDRPWWFNCFIAWPVALVLVAFLPFGYFLCPPFHRYVDGICSALEDSYECIHGAHKLDPIVKFS